MNKTKKHKPRLLTAWVSMLWHAMQVTGKGYKRHSLRNTGRGTDRRSDKLREVRVPSNDLTRPFELVIEHTPFNPPESKLERAARLGRLGLSK